MKTIVFLLTFLLLASSTTLAKGLTIATAANFSAPMKELIAEYNAQSSKHAKAVFGSTGMLYNQILQGAPYDLFFAADTVRPKKLVEQGLASDTFVFARGRLVVWSMLSGLDPDRSWKEAVQHPAVTTIAMANPATAPYGHAAARSLAIGNILHRVSPKIVQAQNVAQSFQYAHSGAADISFTALSLVLHQKSGIFWPVPEAGVIEQSGCIIRTSPLLQEAQDFLAFVRSETGTTIIARYGYE